MLSFARHYSLVFALVLAVGETLIVINTDKYWPLSLDDYLAAALLTLGWLWAPAVKGWLLLLPTWAYVVGNLYAMLFTRLDPVSGSGERIMLLVVALSAAALGATLAALALRQVNRLPAITR